MFTALCIITLIKYKTKIYFGFRQRPYNRNLKLSYYALQVITVVGCGVLAILTVQNDQTTAKIINISTQIAYLVALSMISGVLAYKI